MILIELGAILFTKSNTYFNAHTANKIGTNDDV